ncbi:MAG: M20/M25/M40 family metallo-hydrolase [Cyclobacteriaceae bacterium]
MNKLLLIISIMFFGFTGKDFISLDEIRKMQPESETFELISKLSSDELQGRKPGTNEYEITLKYVESFLNENDIKTYFEGTYRDTVTVRGRTSSNIVAFIGKKDPSKKHIIIGAHLDHLGKSFNSRDNIYNGANDNASGVAAVLQTAKVLNQLQFDQNIIIVLFTEEESGLLGSKRLAKRFKKEKINLAYMLNFEMIGKTLTSGSNQVYLTGYSKSNCASKMNEMIDFEFVKFLPAEVTYNLFRRSDNYSFYKKFKVPCHSISTFDFRNYGHYHKESDEVELLDIKNTNDVINTTTYIVSKLLIQDEELRMNPT